MVLTARQKITRLLTVISGGIETNNPVLAIGAVRKINEIVNGIPYVPLSKDPDPIEQALSTVDMPGDV